MTTPDTPQPTSAQPTVPLPDMQLPSAQFPEAVVAGSEPAPYVAPLPAPPATAPAGATTLAATNAFALVSIVLAFLSPIAAIVFGHMALSQIKRNGDAGRGLALTGTIIGYASLAMVALFFIFYIGFIFIMLGTMGAAISGMEGAWDDSYAY
ncbi:DUF4190 domain-containing protein [Leucobacter sp. gxy201]|uniref:DUF4190 domain-containing protein n=1 Tax=Leucobacter sp. gxy201 TaxID=2957200 RepID=UPI003DA0543E